MTRRSIFQKLIAFPLASLVGGESAAEVLAKVVEPTALAAPEFVSLVSLYDGWGPRFILEKDGIVQVHHYSFITDEEGQKLAILNPEWDKAVYDMFLGTDKEGNRYAVLAPIDHPVMLPNPDYYTP